MAPPSRGGDVRARLEAKLRARKGSDTLEGTASGEQAAHGGRSGVVVDRGPVRAEDDLDESMSDGLMSGTFRCAPAPPPGLSIRHPVLQSLVSVLLSGCRHAWCACPQTRNPIRRLHPATAEV